MQAYFKFWMKISNIILLIFFCMKIPVSFVEAGPRLNPEQSNKTFRNSLSPIFSTLKPSTFLRHSTPSWKNFLSDEQAPVDLIFLIDGSSSINQQSRNEFNILKDWVFNVATQFDIAHDSVRIGVVQYSHFQQHLRLNEQPYIVTEIALGSCNNFKCFRSKLNSIEHQGFTTFTGAAINKTVQFDFATSSRRTHKILVLVTDGPSIDDVMYASAFARSQNVTIFAVGVGRFNLSQLQLIANGELFNNLKVYRVTAFSNLNQIADDLQNEIKATYEIPGCPPLVTPQRGILQCTRANAVGSVCTLTCRDVNEFTVQGSATRSCLLDHTAESGAFWNGVPATCGVCSGKFDLLILLDLSSDIIPLHFQIIKDFVITVVDTFHVSTSDVQISLIHHDGNVVRRWDYNTFTNRHLLLTEVLNLPLVTTKTKQAIPLSDALERTFRSESAKRLDSPHITLIVTDGTATGYLVQKAHDLHLKSKVITVGVGNADPIAVSRIASQPQMLFSLSLQGNYIPALFLTIRDVVERVCFAQSQIMNTSCDWSQISNSSDCSVHLSCTNANKAGSVCTATCCRGYEVPINSATTCNYDGTWTRTSFQCQEKACPAIPPSPGLRILYCTNGCNVSSECLIACDPGYVMANRSANSRCKISGAGKILQCSTRCYRGESEAEPSWDDSSVLSCAEIDECSSLPCQNNGRCTDLINGFFCDCAPGFSGDDCGKNIDDCFANPCNNNATCVDGVDQFKCICAEGFSGVTCEENIDDCQPNPCQNNGICSDKINDYSCSCPIGFAGKNCDVKINWCASLPCQHEGTCISITRTYVCLCRDGYSGLDCSENTNNNGIRCSTDRLSVEERPRSVCDGNGRVGTVCILHCLRGSQPKNSIVNRTCLSNGNWSVPDAQWGCDEIFHCPLDRLTTKPVGNLPRTGRFPFLINSTNDRNLTPTLRMQNLNGKVSANCTNEDRIGSICQLSCAKGYQLKGPDSSVCLPNGRWSHERSVCVRSKCPLLAFSSVTCSNGANVKSMCNRSCPTGMRSFSKTCSPLLVWEPRNPWVCKPYCSDPLPQTTSAAYECSSEDFSGSVCHSRCSDGFVETQKGQFRCVFDPIRRSMFWNGTTGRCEPLQCQNSVDFSTGRTTNFSSNSAVQLRKEPHLPPSQAALNCNYKSVAAVQFSSATVMHLPRWPSVYDSVKLLQVSNDSPTLQHCIVCCLCASCGDRMPPPTRHTLTIIFHLKYGAFIGGQHIQICSSEYNSTITGRNDKLLFESDANIKSNAFAAVFAAHDHIRVRIEPEMINFYNYRLDRNYPFRFSNRHLSWDISFNGGAHRFSNKTLYFAKSDRDFGLCFACISTGN